MPNLRLPSAVVVLALVFAACGSGAASSPGSGGPGDSPASSPEPTSAGVDHPTGAVDVVLRMEEGGGFVPIDFAASQAPSFTLYGDGRIVFKQLLETFPQPDATGVTRYPAWRTAQLDAGQIEELLAFALGPGGIGTAKDAYISGGIADAPNTIFTVEAGGLKKTVVVNAIDMEPSGGPDDAARASLKRLADRLRDFDQGGTISSDAFVPDAYRGILIEQEGVPGATVLDWPWPDLTTADFKEGDGTIVPAFPHHALAADEISALKVDDPGGGVQGIFLKAPNGATYSLTLRPLLPGEKE